MADEKTSSVVLRSNLRRPLTFRVAGKTVRLSPGERLKVSAGWLRSAELQRLFSTGSVAAEAPLAPTVEPDAEQAAETGTGQSAEQIAEQASGEEAEHAPPASVQSPGAEGEPKRSKSARNPPPIKPES